MKDETFKGDREPLSREADPESPATDQTPPGEEDPDHDAPAGKDTTRPGDGDEACRPDSGEADKDEGDEEDNEDDEEDEDDGESPPQGGKMSILGHLAELRKRLIICAACFLIGFALCLSRAEWFTNQLLALGKQHFSFVYIRPAELLMAYIRIALVGAVVICVPVIGFQIWQFIKPGLRKREKLAFALIMTLGLGLFALGAAFAFAIVLPILLGFFARLETMDTVSAMVSVEEYINYVISTMITFGVIFETPIAILSLTGAGLVKPETLQKNFKYVVLLILVAAAIITPPDITSQILVAVPLMLLFYLSILLSKLLFRRKRAKRRKELEDI